MDRSLPAVLIEHGTRAFQGAASVTAGGTTRPPASQRYRAGQGRAGNRRSGDGRINPGPATAPRAGPWTFAVAAALGGGAALLAWWWVGEGASPHPASRAPSERSPSEQRLALSEKPLDPARPAAPEPPSRASTEPVEPARQRRTALEVDAGPPDLAAREAVDQEFEQAAARAAVGHAPAPHDPHAGWVGAAPGDGPAEKERDTASEPQSRHVERVAFSRWQRAGFCSSDNEALDARDVMKVRFVNVPWGPEASLYLDPRLGEASAGGLIGELEAAEGAIRAQLSLSPARPNVFGYANTELLLAAACTNDDVVAYYDGDLHVVPTDNDIAQSVVHEYTHHALITSGIVGPAWAQEGIAMTVARETWWRQRGWLERVAERPFSIDAMERAVPYTLTSEHALSFYVQSAAMVACAIAEEPDGLLSLVRALNQDPSSAELAYELPPLARPENFRACSNELLR